MDDDILDLDNCLLDDDESWSHLIFTEKEFSFFLHHSMSIGCWHHRRSLSEAKTKTSYRGFSTGREIWTREHEIT